MVPAPRDRPNDAPAPPRDLILLREMYQALPHPSVRWQTEPGGQFLDALFMCVEEHQAKGVATALGISTQAIYYMLECTRPSRPRRWPSPHDLRDINAAWRAVRTAMNAGRSVRRKSPEYVPVHQALIELLDQQFTLRDVALAMKVPSRQLNRFIQTPLDSPEAVARAIEELLPQQAADRLLQDNPAWRE
jgi:hypothetical protein